MRIRTLLAAALLACAAHPSLAQEETRARPRSMPGWSLRQTMDSLIAELRDARGFFPERGTWTWVEAVELPDHRWVTGVHRFPAAQTDSAMQPGGPVCDSFHSGDAVAMGTLIYDSGDGRRWRLIGPRRFAPRDDPQVFVEWRREDGRWVVSSFGSVRDYVEPHLAGRDLDDVVWVPNRGAPLHLPLPADGRYAASEPWYLNNQPVTVGGHPITKYGPPRTLTDGDVVLWGSVHGVNVHVEPQLARARLPDVIYVPVDANGSFQAYQNMISNGCD